jgi:ribosome-associated heat shock protein Hsp15
MDEPVRIDKWLWAARFFKTRSLASEAVSGGLVAVNDQRVKPSKDVRVGDRLEITRGQVRFVVDVVATAARRGPASEAVLLYEETPESAERRAQIREERRFAQPPVAHEGGRPTKRDRRRLDAGPGSRRRGG